MGLPSTAGSRQLLLAVTRKLDLEGPSPAAGRDSKVGNFNQSSGGAWPDGLALGKNGGLPVAHARSASVRAFDALGKVRVRIRTLTDILPANLVFGGPKNKALFILNQCASALFRRAGTYPENLRSCIARHN
jgi:sugar lactone lactonase YvrE